MVDNISLVADCRLPICTKIDPTQPFEWKGLLFKPLYAPGNDIYIKGYAAEFKGLRFVFEMNCLKISNSLHKFYKGNNYTDFSFSDINESIRMIEDLTKMKAKQFRVRSLEFGLNISLKANVTDIINSMGIYKTKYPSDLMKWNAQVYGKKWILSEYAVKIYNKSKQVKIMNGLVVPDNLLRVEIEYKKNRVIPGIKTLQDLRNPIKLEQLVKETVKCFNLIVMDGVNDYTKTDSRGREIYFAGNDANFWTIERKLNKDGGKEKKDKFKEVCNLIFVSSYKSEISGRINSKLVDLLGS